MAPQAPERRAPESIEAARKLFAGPCEFIAGAASFESLIAISLPEVAFAGRSNVGKSSLVNALTGRRTLARTSSSPGHTRQINFFDLGRRASSRFLVVHQPFLDEPLPPFFPPPPPPPSAGAGAGSTATACLGLAPRSVPWRRMIVYCWAIDSVLLHAQ